MHIKRLVTAVFLLPLLYLLIMYLPETYFLALLILLAGVALYEFYDMYRVPAALRYPSLLFAILLPSLAFFSRSLLPEGFMIAAMTVLVLRLFVMHDPASSLSHIAAPLTGILYIPALLSYQMSLRMYGPEWILLLYGTVWSADSAAYYLGKGIGRRKLYSSVSPNKTVAGGVGSLIGGLAGALIISTLIIPQLPLTTSVLIGIIIGGVSIVGDLVESMFKRDAGVKDSGRIIPGHGGLLDTIDGVLFAGPVLYWTMRITNVTGP
jgi:phosphatidate cytidylyltransferase